MTDETAPQDAVIKEDPSDKNRLEQAMIHLDRGLGEAEPQQIIPFGEFVQAMAANPAQNIRNTFQTFHDMVRTYVGEGVDEYPDDPESINYVCYDCSRLFVDDSDHPFFADRLFANRLINHVDSMRRGSQQNKIYIFEGPHGCGKSTFLNNLLRKFEAYANTVEGTRYDTVWRLDRRRMTTATELSTLSMFERLLEMQQETGNEQLENIQKKMPSAPGSDTLDIPCPSHDHPLMMIPKHLRRPFLDELLENDEFKWKLFTEKEYEWVFKSVPCTVCESLYHSLLEQLRHPMDVLKMVYARPYRFSRRIGEGISVFNPGDRPARRLVLTNDMLQRRINSIFRDSNQVNYIFSRYAKTNNGVYALMDIKSHNTERLIELHNIISEGVHKVEDIEENVDSLFLALMNPEDKKNIEDYQSFLDRIEYIKIPYVLDINTEVEIYRNIFGRHIDDSFLPRVLHNFARVIISTRMRRMSPSMNEWLPDPERYERFCDENLLLLKMEIYTGYIPPWLSEDDRKTLTQKRRKQIIAESETEGDDGFSGRDSIKIFNDFFSTYAKPDKLINMAALCQFFIKTQKEYGDLVPGGFLDSLQRLYYYTCLQEVKECLYDYNEEQIARDLKNYLFAINFEIGSTENCTYTGDLLHITEEFLEGIESKLLETSANKTTQLAFRQANQATYTTRTLTQEIVLEDKTIEDTEQYRDMHTRYVYNLKEKVLDPLISNENFRRAIKDFDTEDFKTYDEKVRHGVEFLLENLSSKFQYNLQGAREVCLYVIDHRNEDLSCEPEPVD